MKSQVGVAGQQYSLQRRALRADGALHVLLVEVQSVLGDAQVQRLFAGEVEVDRSDRDVCPLGDLVDRGVLHALVVKQPGGGIEDAANGPRLAAFVARGCLGHGMARYPPCTAQPAG